MNKPFFIMLYGKTKEDELYTAPILEDTPTDSGTYRVKFFEYLDDARSFARNDLRCKHFGYEIHQMGMGCK